MSWIFPHTVRGGTFGQVTHSATNSWKIRGIGGRRIVPLKSGVLLQACWLREGTLQWSRVSGFLCSHTCKMTDCKILQAEEIFHSISVCTSNRLTFTDKLLHPMTLPDFVCISRDFLIYPPHAMLHTQLPPPTAKLFLKPVDEFSFCSIGLKGQLGVPPLFSGLILNKLNVHQFISLKFTHSSLFL